MAHCARFLYKTLYIVCALVFGFLAVEIWEFFPRWLNEGGRIFIIGFLALTLLGILNKGWKMLNKKLGLQTKNEEKSIILTFLVILALLLGIGLNLYIF
jgi:hypothetical protein